MQVEVFADLICPRCYIALHHLGEALSRFEHGADVDVVWRGFQLDLVSGRTFGEVLIERVITGHGLHRLEAEDVVADVLARFGEAAARHNLSYNPEIAAPADTFDAHRMVHLAATRGLHQLAVKQIQHGYFAHGMPIGDPETLARLVATVGIDLREARAVVLGNEYRDVVFSDRDRAERLGIWSVPFFLFSGRYAVSGIQSARWLLEAMRHCWTPERAPHPRWDQTVRSVARST